MLSRVRIFVCIAFLLYGAFALAQSTTAPAQVKQLKVTILSTMLADEGIGEWGFAALVETDGHRLLVDTGARPETVLNNVRDLKIDLSDVKEVVLTHNHGDHVGGLLTLRREFMKKNPEALSEVHVGKGIFWSRRGKDGTEHNTSLKLREDFEATGGKFVEHDQPAELFPGIWITGPVPRKYPEKNWSDVGKVQTPDGLVEDTIPEDQSVVINTDRGLVVVAGCGHAGIVNTLTFADARFPKSSIYAVLGGIHLYAATDQQVDWTADKLKGFGVRYVMGAHCTGINTLFRMRDRLKLQRQSAVVGAVGASFVLGEGILPGEIAQ
jgi:7,8-dihydropterin-6-yl-methyl-4-(beta-D-ribofuranosyl)aminobenzene 5'-phosphate synthase